MNLLLHDFSYDPFSKDVMANPFPFYAVLRSSYPVYYLEKYDAFVFSRFQDLVEILTTKRNVFVGSDTTLPDPARLLQHNNGRIDPVALDPLPIGAILPSPHFEVLRNAHTAPLKPRAVRALESMLRTLARERLDELLPQKTFDLTQDYGGIIAASAVCHLLDMPLSYASEVLDLVNQCSLTDQENGGNDIAVTIGRVVELIVSFIAKRRQAGADGSVAMIDGLIGLEYYGRPLTDVEIATQIVCEFIGGTETVPKIMAHGLLELSKRPDQLAQVRSDPERNTPVAIEEMIRFCAPAQWFVRTAHEDVTIAGQDIKVGQRVLLLFGSAARDEREYQNPDDFIWNRRIQRVLSFGMGQHHCTGTHLARLELRVMIDEFLKRVNSYSFDMANAVRYPSSFQWGWNSLPVIIHQSS